MSILEYNNPIKCFGKESSIPKRDQFSEGKILKLNGDKVVDHNRFLSNIAYKISFMQPSTVTGYTMHYCNKEKKCWMPIKCLGK